MIPFKKTVVQYRAFAESSGYCRAVAQKSVAQLRSLVDGAGVAGKAAFLTAAGLMVGSANAAIDTTAATAGVTDMQTAVLAVIVAMTTAMIAIWGAKKVLRLFGR
jgi:hypothetical protein